MTDDPTVTDLSEPTPEEITALKAQRDALKAEIQALDAEFHRLVHDHLKSLEERQHSLQLAIEQLERRKERIEQELRRNFVGASQELAIRVQGFKEFLVKSMQELATTVEEMELLPPTPAVAATAPAPAETATTPPKLVLDEGFQEEADRIRRLLEQYRSSPNYYGPPWQLRRTFEQIHAERVESWFFDLGGRGALRSLPSRLQNILVASAIISILRDFYGDMLRVLVLADSPERLGDWRRGLQDCLGISRQDFGPDQGVALFESADALAFRADRLEQEDYIPLILIDDSQPQVSLSLLQYPLLLGFAPEPQLRPSRSSDFFE
ncbi:DUF3086 domain-containing protein [Thermosynechococcus sp.]|uniref:DUF3086 domain-containing protein n=1 Tax=Thermosynechococcus sp. TaxID=2814275 RepID=UPI00391D5D80